MDESSAGDLGAFRVSTESNQVGERASAWREVSGRRVVHIEIDSPVQHGFRAQATVSRLPGLGAISAPIPATHQADSRDLIVDDDLFFMAGPTCPWRASQRGRSIDLDPGDGVLLSNADAGSITLFDTCRYTTVCIPRSALRPLVPDLEALLPCRIPAANPPMRMLVRYLELAQDAEVLITPELRSAFGNHVCDLLALSIGATRDAAAFAKMRRVSAARLQAMKEDVRNHLDRPELSVCSVAERHHVTPRYVQKLFEESGSTFTRFVLEQRLAAAYKALTDPARSEIPISAVAYDAGFTDLSNFNKAFRRRFGCTPTDARIAARAKGDRHA